MTSAEPSFHRRSGKTIASERSKYRARAQLNEPKTGGARGQECDTEPTSAGLKEMAWLAISLIDRADPGYCKILLPALCAAAGSSLLDGDRFCMRLYYALPIQNAEKASIHSESTIHRASCTGNMVFNLKMWLARCRQSHRFQSNTSDVIQRHTSPPLHLLEEQRESRSQTGLQQQYSMIYNYYSWEPLLTWLDPVSRWI